MFESVVELELEVEVEVEVVVSTLESPPEEFLEESEDFLVEDTVFFSSFSFASSSSVSSSPRGRSAPSPGLSGCTGPEQRTCRIMERYGLLTSEMISIPCSDR